MEITLPTNHHSPRVACSSFKANPPSKCSIWVTTDQMQQKHHQFIIIIAWSLPCDFGQSVTVTEALVLCPPLED